MKRTVLASSVLLVVVLALAAGGVYDSRVSARQTSQLPVIALVAPVTGLSLPIGITHAGDGTGRLFIVEQAGRIRVFKNGALLTTPFLDISSRVVCCGERGLLGLAFPQDYATKNYFYVYYINAAGDSVVARYRRSAADPDTADPSSEQVVITVEQPAFTNHKGGHLAFGPRDRQLYVGLGDGGSGGDPDNRAQNPLQLLGKLLRLDVETGRPYRYTVPPDNPFVGRADSRPEIWALGLRNPWRYSLDRATGDLYTADVGQGLWEEVNFQPAASAGGENYGWRLMEGLHCFNPSSGCNMTGLTLPVHEYSHAGGNCSVTGGYVYRGATFARMQGLYIYGDYCTGIIWGLRRDGTGAWENAQLLDTSINISTFGEDEAGNLYVASHNTGTVFRIDDTGTLPPPPPTPEPARVQFVSASQTVAEQGASAAFTVSRSGDPSVALTVDYATSDATASERGDYTTARGTLAFAPGEVTKTVGVLVTDDARDEADETLNLTLHNVTGQASLGTPSAATLTITDNDPPTAGANPIDDSTFFVRQHYLDFLNREPDAGGLQFWTNNIESCGANQQCREVRRIDTSAAFFLSIEFQETGVLVYLLHKAATGNMPRFHDFMEDTQQAGRDVVVGVGAWQAQLEANKRALVNDFVTRPSFFAQYPTGQTPAQYVDALNANTGGVLTAAERDALVGGLTAGTETRATALRKIAENAEFRRVEFNNAFVLMQYFGYLRRNANDPPDTNFDGFNFWLAKLNQFNGNYVDAEMVKAFIASIEYRQRFGQ